MYLIRRCLNESFITCQCATQNLASRYTNAFGHLTLTYITYTFYLYSCDSRCTYVGNCCPKEHSDTTKAPTPTVNSTYSCYELYPSSYPTGMTVIDSCPDNSTLEAISCSRGDIGEESIYGWLVTDKVTFLT